MRMCIWCLRINGTTSDEDVYIWCLMMYSVTSDKDVQLVFDDERHYF